MGDGHLSSVLSENAECPTDGWSGRPSERLTVHVVFLSRWTARSTTNSAQETKSEVILRSFGSEMAKRYVLGSPCADGRCVFAPGELLSGLRGHGSPLQWAGILQARIPRDRGAWRAAVCGTTQSRERLSR